MIYSIYLYLVVILLANYIDRLDSFSFSPISSQLRIQNNRKHVQNMYMTSKFDGIPSDFIKARRGSRFVSNSNIASGGSKSRSIKAQGLPSIQNNPNRLRIIGGSAKGKKIDSPDVYLRPMMAKVREALFNTLEYMEVLTSHDIRVLDIFSGSGSIGLEALSRGVQYTTFVDFSQNCIDTSLKNAENLGFRAKAFGVCGTAEDVLQHPSKYSLLEPYQLITLTPPYEEVIYKDLLTILINSPLIAENTIVVIEYPVEMGSLPYIIDDALYGIRNRKYGRTVLATYVYKPTRIFDMRLDEFILK